jgi:hypothetical protein
MEIHAMQNKNGLSIISILVAMFVFLVAMLGLLSGIMFSMHLSSRNLLRDEADRIVQEVFDEYRNKSNTSINHDFTTVSGVTCSDCLDNSSISAACHIKTRQINNSIFKFALLFSGKSVSVAGKFVNYDNITVCWRYKGQLYNKIFETVILKSP